MVFEKFVKQQVANAFLREKNIGYKKTNRIIGFMS